MGRKVKRVVTKESICYTKTMSWQRIVDHVTVSAVVNASDQHFTPAVVLPGVMARYRRRVCGSWEIPSDFLPKPSTLLMREASGVNSELFFSWATNFVSETVYLRRGEQNLLLAYYGYGSHVTYRILKLFRGN